MRPGTRPPTCTCWSSWSASACSCTPGKTRGRSCASSPCLPPAPQSPTSTTACRRSVCGSSWRCTLCPGSSSSRVRRRVSSFPWNKTRERCPAVSRAGHRSVLPLIPSPQANPSMEHRSCEVDPMLTAMGSPPCLELSNRIGSVPQESARENVERCSTQPLSYCLPNIPSSTISRYGEL